MTAIIVYSLAVGLLGGSTLFALLAPVSLYTWVTNGVIPVGWARLTGVVGGLGITVVVARWGYTAAARRFVQYTVD